jgi:hypothetical protein
VIVAAIVIAALLVFSVVEEALHDYHRARWTGDRWAARAAIALIVVVAVAAVAVVVGIVRFLEG